MRRRRAGVLPAAAGATLTLVMRPRGRSDALRAAGAAISRLRIFLTVHAVTEAVFLLPLIYTSWALAMLSDDPGLIATYLVLVGGIEHTAVSCMVLISLCFVLCPCCRDVDSALKAYAAFCIIGCCASAVQVVGTALLVNKSEGFEQLAIAIAEERRDGGSARTAGSGSGAAPPTPAPSASEPVGVLWVVVVVGFIAVGAVLLPFRLLGAAWGLSKGCEPPPKGTGDGIGSRGGGGAPAEHAGRERGRRERRPRTASARRQYRSLSHPSR